MIYVAINAWAAVFLGLFYHLFTNLKEHFHRTDGHNGHFSENI
jgi:hypothetical protein